MALLSPVTMYSSVRRSELGPNSMSTVTRRQNSMKKEFFQSFSGSVGIVHRKKAAAQAGRASFCTRMALHEFTNGGGFVEKDENYVDVSVLETTDVRSTSNGFLIQLIDGRQMTCKHAATHTVKLQDSGAQPAIVLRLENGSGIFLPIIVLDYPAQQLKECLRNVPLTRPTVYQVMKEMATFMGYELKLVRITHRVCEAYYARAYMTKVDSNGMETIVSLDMKPSDAINLAARAKVPIQVNKALAEGDGVIPLNTRDPTPQPYYGKKRQAIFMFTDDDKPTSRACADAEEFAIVRAMTVAGMLERYNEAALLRDELQRLREGRRAKSKVSELFSDELGDDRLGSDDCE